MAGQGARNTLKSAKPKDGWPKSPIGARDLVQKQADIIWYRAMSTGSIEGIHLSCRSRESLDAEINALALYLLIELRQQDEATTLIDEKKRVGNILKHSSAMLKEIRGIKKPGVVFHHLSKLGANEPQDLSETDGAVPLVTAASAARAVLWPAYPKGKHPLDAVNSAMKEYVRWLDGDMKQQKGNLAERSKGDARGLLGDASATLLVQWLGPGILGVGMEKQVFDLMNAIWVYAVPRDTKNIDLRKFARDAAARPLEGVKANSGFKAREILAVK